MNAIINSGPREDSTRIGRAGTVRRQAVDVSPLRRVNQVGALAKGKKSQLAGISLSDFSNSLVLCLYLQAIWLLCTGAREAAFRNIKTIAECLADELINAAKVGLRCGT